MSINWITGRHFFMLGIYYERARRRVTISAPRLVLIFEFPRRRI